MLAASHSNPSKRGRKAKRSPIAKGVVPSFTDKYNKADDLVSLVYCDIANGKSRSQVIEKITKGIYDGMEKPLAARTAANYYNAALDRFAVDTDIEAERLRKMFYGRYESLLEEAVNKGDLYNARGILDSMSRIFGIEQKNPQTAIQINSDKEGGININFGFSEKQDAEVIE